MSEILSIILFIVLTGVTFWAASGRAKKLKSPFDKDVKMRLTGEEYFVILVFATALFECGMFISTRLLVNELLCLMVIFRCKRSRAYSVPMILYIVYFIWIIIGCFYTYDPIYGVRALIKYIYPLLVVIVCSRVVNNAEVAIKSGVLARKVGIVAAVVGCIPLLEYQVFGGVLWYGTARAINFISLMIFSLSLFFYEEGSKKQNLLFALFFLIPCFLWVFRTSILGSFVALAMFALFRYKIWAIPFIAAIVAAGVICVFTIPSLKEKMFFDKDITFEEVQNGELDDKTINTNGRAAMWEYLEHKFYKGREWYGSGTGSVQQEMYTNSEFYGGIKIAHSDYVQMRCDNGNVGLILYLLAMISVIIHCAYIFTSKGHNKYIKICAITAGSALAGVLATLYSDNTVNYSMCTLSFPMGFYGMMLGLLYAEADKERKEFLERKEMRIREMIARKIKTEAH